MRIKYKYKKVLPFAYEVIYKSGVLEIICNRKRMKRLSISDICNTLNVGCVTYIEFINLKCDILVLDNSNISTSIYKNCKIKTMIAYEDVSFYYFPTNFNKICKIMTKRIRWNKINSDESKSSISYIKLLSI